MGLGRPSGAAGLPGAGREGTRCGHRQPGRLLKGRFKAADGAAIQRQVSVPRPPRRKHSHVFLGFLEGLIQCVCNFCLTLPSSKMFTTPVQISL